LLTFARARSLTTPKLFRTCFNNRYIDETRFSTFCEKSGIPPSSLCLDFSFISGRRETPLSVLSREIPETRNSSRRAPPRIDDLTRVTKDLDSRDLRRRAKKGRRTGSSSTLSSSDLYRGPAARPLINVTGAYARHARARARMNEGYSRELRLALRSRRRFRVEARRAP
jgi:hypothetical protein